MKTSTIQMGRAAAFASALAVVMTMSARGARADEPTATAPPPTAVATQPATTPPAYAPPGAAAGGAPVIHGISVWGILPWSGIGIGARYMLPLPIPPLLVNTNLRDSFNLEFGADYLHWSYDTFGGYSWSEVVPVVGMMWNIWFTPQFALYPKIEFGYAMGWISGWNYGGTSPTYGGFFWDGDAGALYKMQNGLTLRAEVGVDGLKLGAGWLF